MSYARAIHPGKTYLITRRTERRHCLLRPDSRINRFILYALCIAASRHGILVHAFCAMSTHLHYVVTDPFAKLPRFLETFHCLVARGVKAIRQWNGAVWDGAQTSIVELCTRQAIVEKIAYTLVNPVEAGLVWKSRQWPGAKTTADDIGKKTISVLKPIDYFNPRNPNWIAKARLDIVLPPSIPISDSAKFRREIAAEIAKLELLAHTQIPKREILGAKRAMNIAPESRITSRELIRQRNPTFAVGRNCTREIVSSTIATLRAFRAAYREALKKWRAGNRYVEFPAGTYALRILHCVNVCTAG